MTGVKIYRWGPFEAIFALLFLAILIYTVSVGGHDICSELGGFR